MNVYIPIPPPPVPQYGQTIREYGLDLMVFMTQHGTATLSAEQLELIDSTAQLGATNYPAKLTVPQALALLNLSDIRHTVALVLKFRRQQETKTPMVAPPPQGGGQGGRVAPLIPPTPSLPPSNVALRF